MQWFGHPDPASYSLIFDNVCGFYNYQFYQINENNDHTPIRRNDRQSIHHFYNWV